MSLLHLAGLISWLMDHLCMVSFSHISFNAEDFCIASCSQRTSVSEVFPSKTQKYLCLFSVCQKLHSFQSPSHWLCLVHYNRPCTWHLFYLYSQLSVRASGTLCAWSHTGLRGRTDGFLCLVEAQGIPSLPLNGKPSPESLHTVSSELHWHPKPFHIPWNVYWKQSMGETERLSLSFIILHDN